MLKQITIQFNWKLRHLSRDILCSITHKTRGWSWTLIPPKSNFTIFLITAESMKNKFEPLSWQRQCAKRENLMCTEHKLDKKKSLIFNWNILIIITTIRSHKNAARWTWKGENRNKKQELISSLFCVLKKKGIKR